MSLEYPESEVRETRSETLLVDLGFDPSEGTSGLVVVLDEGIDVCPELSDAGEAGALQRLATEDREPALYLIEPGGVGRREVE